MVPALTCCPPNRLTPSLCPWESRPLVEEPPPFLCAMTLSFSEPYSGRSPDRSNYSKFLQLNIANLHSRIILPVPPRNLILIRFLKLQHGNLLIPPMTHNLPGYGSLRSVITRQNLLFVVVHRQNRAKSHLLTHITLNPLDPNRVAGRDSILFSSGLNYGVHRPSKIRRA